MARIAQACVPPALIAIAADGRFTTGTVAGTSSSPMFAVLPLRSSP